MTAKPSWPLVALGATSFIPGLGFLLGSIAVTWGLVSDRPRARLAVILGASGALLQLVAMMVWIVGFRDSPTIRLAETELVMDDLGRLVRALDAYRTAKGVYPATLEDLVGRPIPVRFLNIRDQSGDMFRPRIYQYRLAGDGRTYDLFSLGLDGVTGTADDIRPVLSDSALAHSGYRPPRPPP